MPWAVVEFLSRNEVEAVPVCWLQDNETHCLWPEKSFRQSELIRKQAQPDESWRLYEVRVFDRYESLSKAREKCKRSEIYSDLSSGTEDKRKRSSLKTFIRPNCCDSEEEGPKKKLKYGKETSSDSEHSDSNSNLLLPLPEFQNCTSVIEKEQEESTGVSNKNCVIFTTPQRQTDKTPKLTPVETSSKKDCDQEWKRKVDNSLSHIKLMLEHIVDILESSPNQRGNKNSDEIIDEISDRCPIDLNSFPISSDEQLKQVENLLSNKETHVRLVRDLARVGGKTVKETTRRLLRRIFTNNLAQTYSYFGFKKKQVFQSLRMNSVIHDAVKKNKETERATEKEIEAEIQDWLRQAKGRIQSKEKIGGAVNFNPDNSSL